MINIKQKLYLQISNVNTGFFRASASRLTNEYLCIHEYWIAYRIVFCIQYSSVKCIANTFTVVSIHSEYEYRRLYAYSLFKPYKVLIMIFIFSIQTHHGYPKLFIFGIQFILAERYSVFKTVFSKAKYKVFTMQFSIQFYVPRRIQYAMQYSVNTYMVIQNTQ